MQNKFFTKLFESQYKKLKYNEDKINSYIKEATEGKNRIVILFDKRVKF